MKKIKKILFILLMNFPLILFSQNLENGGIYTSSGTIGISCATFQYVFGQYINYDFGNNQYKLTSTIEAVISIHKKTKKEDFKNIVSTKLFPNPVTNQLNISITSTEKITSIDIKIYDTKGNRIMIIPKISNYDNFSKISFSTENLTTGIYFAKITINRHNLKTINFTKQ